MPTWILEQELAEPLIDRTAPPGHAEAVALVRLEGQPLGTVRVAVQDGVVSAAALRAAIVASGPIAFKLSKQALRAWLARPEPSVVERRAVVDPATLPTWTVVVCTRERPEDLRRCVEALLAMTVPAGEILVVDNAPSTSATRDVVEALGHVPSPHRLRYLCEDRPGQNWARAAGARAATGEIVAYTDDDVVVDRRWIAGLLPEFVGDRTVGAVTGPAPALELVSEAQELFESRGFVRGWERRVFDSSTLRPVQSTSVGAGANAAFRRDLLLELRPFSHEMDGGTATMSGGDSYAFYLVLAHGWRVVYTPDALVWHRHRRDYESVAYQLRGYSVGGFSMLLRCFFEHREAEAARLAMQWLWHDHVRALARLVLRRPTAMPAVVVRQYWRGVFEAPLAYWRSRRRERRLLAADRAAGVRDFAPGAAAGTPGVPARGAEGDDVPGRRGADETSALLVAGRHAAGQVPAADGAEAERELPHADAAAVHERRVAFADLPAR